MTRIAHLSDLHFGMVDEAVLEGLVDELAADRPDLVVVSGDVTMRARRAEFQAAQKFFARLRSPLLAVPGNHDMSAFHLVQRFVDPFARWREFIAEQTEPLWADSEVLVLGLNTARSFGWHWNWSHGRFGRRQIARVEERLAAMPKDLARIIVAHHPMMPPPSEPHQKLAGRAALALETFSRSGVRMVLSGHLHHGYIRAHGTVVGGDAGGPGAIEVAAPSRQPILIVHASTTTSVRRRDEPNGYNRIAVSSGAITIEPRVWTGTAWMSPNAPASVAR